MLRSPNLLQSWVFVPSIVFLLALTACQRTPHFRSFGWEIVEVANDSGVVASAVYATHREMADWQSQGDGKQADPSFADHGRSWKAGSDHPESAVIETCFRAKTGGDCVITRIKVGNRPVLILLKSKNEDLGMELHNTFVKNLVKAGARPL